MATELNVEALKKLSISEIKQIYKGNDPLIAKILRATGREKEGSEYAKKEKK